MSKKPNTYQKDTKTQRITRDDGTILHVVKRELIDRDDHRTLVLHYVVVSGDQVSPLFLYSKEASEAAKDTPLDVLFAGPAKGDTTGA